MITQTMFNSKFYRFLPVVILIIGIIEFFSFGGQIYLSLNALKDNYQSIIVFANNHFLLIILVFSCAYINVLAHSITVSNI
ncbi:TVP38/TMEM64 family protein, partial [Francisella tularensis subsp. holarctica]|nr:TVP38/TMEM64 family protein [Francisella tularensis subsp. holarctica]